MSENHSNSSLNSFLSCMRRYQYEYVEDLPPETVSLDLEFGKMAHEVMCNVLTTLNQTDDMWYELLEACRRELGIPKLLQEAVMNYAPQEGEYLELKDKFGITNWVRYFVGVIKQVLADIGTDINKNFPANVGLTMTMFEKRITMPKDSLWYEYHIKSKKPLVGVIDNLVLGYCEDDSNGEPSYALILDYKFSSRRKKQADFDEDSQLQIYAMLVNFEYPSIPMENIRIGYIDIPKTMFDSPQVLKNGTLSKNKSQNTSAELYKKAILDIHGEDRYYTWKAGGYYEDIVNELALNKTAYTQIQWVDEEINDEIIKDVVNTIQLIDMIDDAPFLVEFPRKYNTYACSGCPYKSTCKPWLGVDINDEGGLSYE